MIGVFLAIGIALIIVALVVRDQTEFKLTRLRAELLALRSEEQRLNEDRLELERLIAQAGEALMRADHRQQVVAKSSEELVAMLQQLGAKIDREDNAELPQPETD